MSPVPLTVRLRLARAQAGEHRPFVQLASRAVRYRAVSHQEHRLFWAAGFWLAAATQTPTMLDVWSKAPRIAVSKS